TTAEALNIIKPIMFRLFDESVTMSFLTSYGSYHVAENLREMSFTADELRRTIIYAWLEFDGSMYMMQNGSEGMERVFRLVRDVMGGKQAGCVAFNHWRTAENLLPGSYGAAAGAGFIPAKEYYTVYGGKYALGEGFAPLMAEIAEADLLLREKLFNIGFCYLGCYLNWGGDDPVSWLAAYPEDALESARAIYLDAARRAEELAESCGCADGILRLRLISSRCRASAKHIDYVLAMRSLSVYGKDGAPNDASRSEIAGIISKAQGFATEYMRILSEIMPDRGCQGTLVSYNCTILPYIDFIRRALLENDRSKTRYGATFDCPLPQG
nr:hypothetical protein [Clostridiales bacterium]